MSGEASSPEETGRNWVRRRLMIGVVAGLLCVLAVPLAPRTFEFARSRFGPYQKATHECIICGITAELMLLPGVTAEGIWQPQQTKLYLMDGNDCSDWVDTIIDPDHDHHFVTVSAANRSRWFGPKQMATNDVFSARLIYAERQDLGEQRARELVLKFQQLVEDGTLNQNDESMYEFFVNEGIIQ